MARKKEIEEIGLYNPYELSWGEKIEFPSTRNLHEYGNRIYNRYPARSVFLVPRAILSQFKDKNIKVLDPFMGSGTTAVETILSGNIPYGLEMDPFARMVAEASSFVFNKGELEEIIALKQEIINNWRKYKPEEKPHLSGVERWFKEGDLESLLRMKKTIICIVPDKYQKFFLVTYADAIKPVSLMERQSLKPYISTKYTKVTKSVDESFEYSFNVHFDAIKEMSEHVKNGGAIRWKEGTGNIHDCIFINNKANDAGGAISMYSGTVTNCNFNANTAGGGGAINMGSGTVTNCNFASNTANDVGGAINMDSGTVLNCNFNANSATVGGAIYMVSGSVTNCNFTANGVTGGGGAIYSVFDTTADTCIFKTSSDTNVNVVTRSPTLNVDNFTSFYGSGEKLIFNLTTNSGMPVTNGNISISVYFKDNGVWVRNYTCLSGEGWIPDLPAGSYIAVFDTEYAEFQKINRTVTITINKIKTELSADAVTTTYNVNKYLTITLKDVNGNPLKGVSIYVDLNGAKTYTTDGNGQVKVSTKGLAPKTYTAKVTFNGNDIYDKSVKNVKVTVKKAASKITAAKKTFKAKTKVKKYAVVLKDNTGKAIKNAKLTLKVRGKTYSAKTNYKGKAVFKITKLNKKGTYKAVIKFNGNKYYLKSTKNTKITVKASKTTFKTVSQGSKDTKTVKKIQQALKDHGYYLSYKGHYLKVDGKYNSYTVRSVKEFQRDHGLKQTGKVDAKTAKKLGII